MTIEQHFQQLQFQSMVGTTLLVILMLFTFAAVLGLHTKNESYPRGVRQRSTRRESEAQAKREAEEKALNDAIEAAVAKLLRGNEP